MSRDEAIEAVENFFEDSDAARTFAVEIVDAVFAASGIDPDKTLYQIDLTVDSNEYDGLWMQTVSIINHLKGRGVLVEVGKEDT